MNPSSPQKGCFDLIEEAVHLLRKTPFQVLMRYYIGSMPFILGLLYFWADMSRNAFAQQYCSIEAFGLSTLFIWMKTWQSEFLYCLRSNLIQVQIDPMNFRKFLNKAFRQTIVQPSGLIILPLSLIFALPFAWSYAFYQNFSALDHEKIDLQTCMRHAWHQAKLYPLQNHLILSIIFLFSLFVFLNIGMVIYLIPYMIKMFFGVETIFTISGHAYLNTTFLAVAVGISYLCVDPLIKTIYSLRCYYGLSLHTGEDLLVELNQIIQMKQ